MKALVVYESMFGNTAAVARAVADGLGALFEVTVADVCTSPRVEGVDLVVLGGPTHAFGLSRPSTRQDAVRQGAGNASGVEIGLREWLDAAPPLSGIPAAVFDTKIDRHFTGSAGQRIDRRLRRLGCPSLAPVANFHVDGTPGPPADGELDRARRWGESIAARAATAVHRI